MKPLKVSIKDLIKDEILTGSEHSIECQDMPSDVKSNIIDINYSLTKIDEGTMLKGAVTGQTVLSCSRCLEDAAYQVDLGLNRIYEPGTEEVDLGEEIRQLLILNLPQKPLCNSECKGICQKCGKNRNATECGCTFDSIDPRWQKLEGLINKNKKSV